MSIINEWKPLNKTKIVLQYKDTCFTLRYMPITEMESKYLHINWYNLRMKIENSHNEEFFKLLMNRNPLDFCSNLTLMMYKDENLVYFGDVYKVEQNSVGGMSYTIGDVLRIEEDDYTFLSFILHAEVERIKQ